MSQLGTTTRDLVIVPGASHLFEQKGALPRVAELAAGLVYEVRRG